MKDQARRFLTSALFACLLTFAFSQDKQITISGIVDEVSINVDRWGIPHIYAKNTADLFFAQGYYAASDRLFQFEIWRRQATGTIAEILGPRELQRDIGTRLFKFRGNMDEEMQHYHPKGKLIIESFVRGVNAYIMSVQDHPERLPLEFHLLDIRPGLWTSEVVISRHQGLLGNIEQELSTARLVHSIGVDKTHQISWFHPKTPDLSLDSKIDGKALFDDILELYTAYRRPVRFAPEDLVVSAQNDVESYRNLAILEAAAYDEMTSQHIEDIGSNNWIVSGTNTQSGFPIMANDPHRTLAVPSLRYMAHLVAPGWNVIGGGEPEIPGISIGHNAHGAWGLTVFRTDAEDLYVYQTHPENPNAYLYEGAWEDMRLIRDEIPVRGHPSEKATYKYTRHGPVVYEDKDAHIAYAIRCGWLEPGGSPYLASLRMDQARNWEEFRDACAYSNIPGENMIWADREGNIGWQAVGIAPVRNGWSGLVPVPGDGSYEWDGYLPIKDKPHRFNPDEGLFITANANVTPPDYDHWEAIGFSWAAPYRSDRLHELLDVGRKHTISDMCRYQTDYLAIPARTLVPLLDQLHSENPVVEKARTLLTSWDCRMSANSVPAGIYRAWERALAGALEETLGLGAAAEYYSLPIKRMIDWLEVPGSVFGNDPINSRDAMLIKALEAAVSTLAVKYGEDMNAWQYGQIDYKHVLIPHPLSPAVNDSIRSILEVGPLPRGGYSYTVNNTGSGNNQRSGASFRLICDAGDWDRAVAMNSPGQAGDPADPHYRNLFELWARDQFFPLYFSKKKIEQTTVEVIRLTPDQ